jgi:hypothetical protein
MAKHHSETAYDEKSFAALKCPVLLMDSERSDAFGRQSWEQLKKMLPSASSDMWEGYGALGIFVKGDVVAHKILKFLSETDL